ncbi:MAG: tRNA 2-selenouridine(34) synthase MnmH [Arenibacterium sp.]
MAQHFDNLQDLLDHGFDAVIDVRSPSEFAEDHVPGAINLPVLDDTERAEIGTIYKQVSPFDARKAGAALVFRNAAHHIDTALSGHAGDWRPLVYCWRGGQRSGAFTWMLSQIGWRADVLEGGYRSYRRLVNALLYDTQLPHLFIALDGYTGTAKTDLLRRVRARGVQVLDLEGLARHRGSLLGATTEAQPSQKSFESAIAQALCNFDPQQPVLIEAESSKIGTRILPPAIWDALKAAPRIDVTAPLEVRCQYLRAAYDDILSDAPRLREKLNALRVHRGHAIVDNWQALIDADDKLSLTRALMVDHYDPAYDKGRRAFGHKPVARLELSSLTNGAMDKAAGKLIALVEHVARATL